MESRFGTSTIGSLEQWQTCSAGDRFDRTLRDTLTSGVLKTTRSASRVVAHGGTNAVALGFLLGLDPTPWEWERFVLGHASIASVRSVSLAGGHVFSLRAFNDQEHLPGDLRSR